MANNRSYAQILLTIWTDDEWTDLTVHAQHLYLTLLSHSTLTYAGVGDWRPNRIAALATGQTTNDVIAAAVELTEAGFVVIDTDTEEYLIRSFVKNDGVMKQPNLATAMARDYAGIASKTIRGVIVHELIRLKNAQPDLKGWGSEEALRLLENRAIDPFNDPSDDPSDDPSIDPSDDPSVKGERNPSIDPCPIPIPLPNTLNPRGKGSSNYSLTRGRATRKNSDQNTTRNATDDTTDGDDDQPPQPTGTPLDWTTRQNPKCRQHTHLADEHTPPCRKCAQTRIWFQNNPNAEHTTTIKAIKTCTTCDDNGWKPSPTGHGVTKCNHQPPQPHTNKQHTTPPKTRPNAHTSHKTPQPNPTPTNTNKTPQNPQNTTEKKGKDSNTPLRRFDSRGRVTTGATVRVGGA